MRTKLVTLRVHPDLHAQLTAQAEEKGCTIARLLSELLDLADIASQCERVEVTWPSGSTRPPTVRVWIHGQEQRL